MPFGTGPTSLMIRTSLLDREVVRLVEENKMDRREEDRTRRCGLFLAFGFFPVVPDIND